MNNVIPPLTPPWKCILACPVCRLQLDERGAKLYCANCQRTYAFQNNVACFVPVAAGHPVGEETDGLFVTLKNFFKRFPGVYRVLVAVFGISFGGLSPRRFLTQYVPAEGVVLDLGSGSQGQRLHPGVVHVDLFAFPGVDVVTDIARLPFPNACVDAVMCLEVLEHIPNPQAVVAEMQRVLKPGGVCYLTTPFLFPYHSSPHDYQRWTLDGLRVLMGQGMEEVSAGLRHGPTSALATLFAHWLAVLLSFGSRRIYGVVLVITTVLCAPIAHVFDLLLNRFHVSEGIASGYYIVTRKGGSSDPAATARMPSWTRAS